MRIKLIIVGSIVLGLLLLGACGVLVSRGNGEAAAAQTATARPNISVGVLASATPGPTVAGTKSSPAIVKTQTPVPVVPTLVIVNTAVVPALVPTIAAPTLVPTTTVEYKIGWDVAWYQSPFVGFTKPQLADKAAKETYAEPGVLLDNTAAFDHLTAGSTPLLVPENARTYVATDALKFGNVTFPYVSRNVYLLIFRGIPSDGDPATDLNKIVTVSGYTPGAGIFDIMPAGAYVSQNWFVDQIANSGKGPNCGEGCLTVTVAVIDLQTATYRLWTTTPSNPTRWVRK